MKINIRKAFISFFSLSVGKEKNIKFIDLLGIFIIIILWTIASRFLGPTRLPSPLAVVIQLYQIIIYSPQYFAIAGEPARLLPHLAYTVRITLIGLITGSLLGITAGMIISRNIVVRDILLPPIEGIRAIPALGLVPFLIMWFGPGAISHILLISIYCSLLMVIYTLNAIRNIDPIYSQFAQTLGANKKDILRTITFPAMLPELLGGIRVAAGMSWGFQIVAEWMGTSLGVGLFFGPLVRYFQIAGAMATIIYVVIVAVIFDRIILYGLGYSIRWVAKD